MMEAMNRYKMKQKYDVLIVLGAQVRPEGVPSEALRRRMTLALKLYQEWATPIICCGAQGHREPMPEGEFMCRWLEERGVLPALLHCENHSYDTMENLRNAKVIMAEQGYENALVITSDYHVRRALAICRRNGISAGGMGSPSIKRYWLKNNARELLAWVKFYLFPR